MQTTIQIDGQAKSIHSEFVSVDDLYKIADCNEERLFLSRDDDIDIPLLMGEFILIHGGERLVVGKTCIEDNPPLRNMVRPEFNGSRNIALPQAKITGKALKEQDDKFPQGRLFADIEDGVDVEITDDMTIVIQDADSYFVIPPASDDAIDLEECGKNERRPPKGHKYRIRIDGEKHNVDSAEITGIGILALVEKRDDEWSLNQKLHGGKRERIGANDLVDLSRPGIERFETVRRQAQQGMINLYELPLEDIQYLNEHYPSQWRKVTEGNSKYGLCIDDFPIPAGYTVENSTLMVLIPSGYPGSILDMFYFFPLLTKSNGSSINALCPEFHFGQTWQRWSRHYKWQPGFDSVVTHIEFVKNQLNAEVG